MEIKEFIKRHILVLYFCTTWLIGIGIMLSLIGNSNIIFWAGFIVTIISGAGMSVCPTWKEFLNKIFMRRA